MYSEDDARESFSAVQTDSDDDQSWLYPHYVKNVGSFICPGTHNFIRITNAFTNWLGNPTLKDLSVYAGNKLNPGSSYELFGWWGASKGPLRNNRKTRVNVGLWVYSYPSSYVYCEAYLGRKAFASCAILTLDGDDGDGGTRNNIPDPCDNHGNNGANISYCDGHAAFVSARAESNYISAIYLGTDSDP
jgi:prepilin-type processing-associated H-X9-DG protein